MSSYLEARKAFGLSREKLSNLAKLAGVKISPASIKKLEDEGEKAFGSRGLGEQEVGYIDYVLGIGTFEATDWSTVEKGAPVIVSGEKGTFSFHSVNDNGDVTVFSDKFRYFAGSRVRLLAPTALPSPENAHLFETRPRGNGGAYASQIMGYIRTHGDLPHAVGSIAYAIGLDNGVVSRTVAALVKAGELEKIGRGVVALPNRTVAPGASEGPLSDAEWEASASNPQIAEDIPQF